MPWAILAVEGLARWDESVFFKLAAAGVFLSPFAEDALLACGGGAEFSVGHCIGLLIILLLKKSL